jgi:hypothetical protein
MAGKLAHTMAGMTVEPVSRFLGFPSVDLPERSKKKVSAMSVRTLRTLFSHTPKSKIVSLVFIRNFRKPFTVSLKKFQGIPCQSPMPPKPNNARRQSHACLPVKFTAGLNKRSCSMSEIVANLFVYVHDEVVEELGVVRHDLEGTDDQKIAFLKSQVIADASRSTRHPLPVANIKIWIGVDATNGLPFQMYSYLARTGNALRFFEEPLAAINAPQESLVCITPIVDGKPKIDVVTHVNPLASPEMLNDQFDGVVKRTDFLAAYTTPNGLDVHELLADDFTNAIKLLCEHKHYVSATKLLVSFVDTVAYLEFGDVQGNYEKWLSKYAALALVGITASELWEFRNSLLHMTNPLSRKVLAGNAISLHFCINAKLMKVRFDKATDTKLFSFEILYETIIQALDSWTKSYSGNLAKQLEFIERYDTILSEARIARLTPN